MPGPPLSVNPPQAVIREGDLVRFVPLAEAREIHDTVRGSRWLPQKFPVHRSNAAHTFIDRDDGSCPHCRSGGQCRSVRVSALEITPTAPPRSPKGINEDLYRDELREMLEWLPDAVRTEMRKFDLRSLSREQVLELAQEASEVLRAQAVPWIQPDGSKILLWRDLPKMKLTEIVLEWMKRAKARRSEGNDDQNP
jgi:hypothetical protein